MKVVQLAGVATERLVGGLPFAERLHPAGVEVHDALERREGRVDMALDAAEKLARASDLRAGDDPQAILLLLVRLDLVADPPDGVLVGARTVGLGARRLR